MRERQRECQLQGMYMYRKHFWLKTFLIHRQTSKHQAKKTCFYFGEFWWFFKGKMLIVMDHPPYNLSWTVERFAIMCKHWFLLRKVRWKKVLYACFRWSEITIWELGAIESLSVYGNNLPKFTGHEMNNWAVFLLWRVRSFGSGATDFDWISKSCMRGC